jgi:LuxR family transcriptional regulator, maltose regulon positive regulatory protein
MDGSGSVQAEPRHPSAERFPFTKFLPPVIDDRVATDHLVAHLEAAIGSRPLTVITAPAGSGKTTALAAWAAAAVGDVVWIRLGPDDDEPTVLAGALLESGRRQLGHGFGGRLAQLLAYAGAAPGPRQLAASLVNDLGDHGAVTLVLDDVHELSGATTSAFLDELLDLLPTGAKVVLGSRVEPAVSLPRRRVRGEVAELGLEDLLLDRDAIAHVLGREAAVGEADVEAVLAATGGWAAAVRLATAHLGVDPSQPPATTRSGTPDVSPDLQRFLAEEVLDGLPDELRRFLLETSILEELSPADCDAVTGRVDSQEVLAELDRRNLFLTRHRGSAGDAWRTHDLFTAFLREQLAASYSADRIRELHRRAADAVPPLRAVPHLLAAEEHAAAAAVIAVHGFAESDLSTALRLAPAIRALPAEVRDANHLVTLVQVLPWLAAGRTHDVLRELEPLLDRLVSAGEELAAAEVSAMLAPTYLQIGDLDRAGAAIDRALEGSDDPAFRTVTLGIAIWWNYYRNDWAAASRCLVEAVDQALRSGERGLYREVGSVLSPELLFVDRGPAWLGGVVERLTSGLTDDDRATLTALRTLRAGVAVLSLQIPRALEELHRCVSESLGYGRLAWKHQVAEGLLLTIALGTGDLRTVQRILDDALPRLDDPVYLQYRTPYLHAALRLHWLAGEHREVIATYDRFRAAGPSLGHADEMVLRAVAESMVARLEGRMDDASRLLCHAEELQRDGRCWWWTGMPGLDRADILLEDGRAAAAIEAALPTLDVAARVGPGILLQVARTNRAVLERCARAGVHGDLIRAVLAVSDPGGSRTATAIPGTDEVLSARELEVLAEVAAGASNRAIAGALFISEATVKSHLTRILRKLGASSRTQAVARARELRLL